MTLIVSLGPEITQPFPKEPLNTPEEIKNYLIKQGILPTPEEAKSTYWSLGKDWWKQLIDGWAHKHGPLVFDMGLHGGFAEPGYLKGIEAASHFLQITSINHSASSSIKKSTPTPVPILLQAGHTKKAGSLQIAQITLIE